MTLARSVLGRTGAAEAAALRDGDGRTYAAANVDLPSLSLSAVEACVVAAASGGSVGVEAVVAIAPDLPALDALRDFAGAGVPVYRVSVSGSVEATATT